MCIHNIAVEMVHIQYLIDFINYFEPHVFLVFKLPKRKFTMDLTMVRFRTCSHLEIYGEVRVRCLEGETLHQLDTWICGFVWGVKNTTKLVTLVGKVGEYTIPSWELTYPLI